MIIEYIREREKREKSFIAFQNSSYSVPTKFIFLFFPLHRSRRKFVFFSSLPFFTSFHHPFSLGDVLLLCWNFDVNRREQLSCYVKTLDAKIMERKRRDRKREGSGSIENAVPATFCTTMCNCERGRCRRAGMACRREEGSVLGINK